MLRAVRNLRLPAVHRKQLDSILALTWVKAQVSITFEWVQSFRFKLDAFVFDEFKIYEMFTVTQLQNVSAI